MEKPYQPSYQTDLPTYQHSTYPTYPPTNLTNLPTYQPSHSTSYLCMNDPKHQRPLISFNFAAREDFNIPLEINNRRG